MINEVIEDDQHDEEDDHFEMPNTLVDSSSEDEITTDQINAKIARFKSKAGAEPGEFTPSSTESTDTGSDSEILDGALICGKDMAVDTLDGAVICGKGVASGKLDIGNILDGAVICGEDRIWMMMATSSIMQTNDDADDEQDHDYDDEEHFSDANLIPLDPVIEKGETQPLRSAMKQPSETVGGRRMRLRRGITMDTGASANVMPKRMIRHPGRIRPSPGSLAGVKYVAANGGIIKNDGEYDFPFTTAEGHDETITMQVAEVNKALGSVAYFVDHRYRVVYDTDENTGQDISMMTHKPSGRVTRFRRERNIWILDAFTQIDPVKKPVFSRPGR